MIVQASFEDFIYIILGLAWIIFSFYKAKKKKKEKEAQSQTSEKKSFVESLLNEMGLQDEQEDPHFSEPYREDINQDELELNPSANEEVEKVLSYDDYYEEGNYNSIDDVIEKEPQMPIKKTGGTNKIPDKSFANAKIRKNIDLRKAVIYSEILKKVYF